MLGSKILFKLRKDNTKQMISKKLERSNRYLLKFKKIITLIDAVIWKPNVIEITYIIWRLRSYYKIKSELIMQTCSFNLYLFISNNYHIR